MIFKYMKKTNCNQIDSDRIDIVRKYEKKESKMFTCIIFAVIIVQLINSFLDRSMISSIISILMSVGIIVAMGYYFWFKKTKYKRIEKERSDKGKTTG